MNLHTVLLITASLATSVHGNVEKVVFLGPSPVAADIYARLHDLSAASLSSQKRSVRLSLPVALPDEYNGKELQFWYSLDGLTLHKRYEVRICWAAIVRRAAPLVTAQGEQTV